MGLAEMAAVDQGGGKLFFRARAIEVRAGVGHDTVGPNARGEIAEVGDDRVLRHPGSMPNATQRLEVGVTPRPILIMRGAGSCERGRAEISPVAASNRSELR